MIVSYQHRSRLRCIPICIHACHFGVHPMIRSGLGHFPFVGPYHHNLIHLLRVQCGFGSHCNDNDSPHGGGILSESTDSLFIHGASSFIDLSGPHNVRVCVRPCMIAHMNALVLYSHRHPEGF